MFRAGPRNLITDVAGLSVGNAADAQLKSGVTVVLCDEPAVAGVQVLGGAPGTRETDLLEPHNTIETVHAIVLSGGSAFGLDAASGVQAALRERNIGVEVGGFRVPIVPAAILFDLRNAGDKDWGRYPPYRELGYAAVQAAAVDFPIGTAGAGTGALTSGLKGGLGSASTLLDSGITIGALAAVNPIGSVTVGRSRHFWAAPFEIGEEFGALGYPDPMPEDARRILLKFRDRRFGAQAVEGGNTTIAVIATDAVLSKSAAKRLAIAAHDGFVRAIWPTHTPADGDLVFALATGRSGIELSADAAIDLYTAAGATMARAIARGVFAATPAEGDIFPVWSSR
ncbi:MULTISPECIES: P1 family peptidase [unclassified Mesorhizobium]|uniref:P1 family peptidase n=1 Tax=unclassified Mesorhizobium TaxID=325217 RepID=UPI000BB0BDD8|nr:MULTISPECIES: P1 family peptidase [unclassified Mesorhizobium]TGT53359.1 S58 family peptidase [Mesorhizobium sp. M00.F.Ca.ET.170.01.1.1]AZO12719.1 S58 family peptidase [Mesorhizobium sp. M3A.F.Ca.ET.080.04.2.1]PBB87152.1 peptidase T4 [Mesorhizobium sp. WSM3876]RWB91226.1 MAG: S58 family peptidase [Mesorhizobium sp.]TGS68393.1 S58 family peptidase [Mesorhizobium sp. M3A.F.Ca.ET.201.01.1.1]